MMITTLEGEVLEGYHLETIPQFNTDDQVDMNALSSLAGMRAVWLLYQTGKWEHLEDLGVDRAKVEPVLKGLRYDRRLTPQQAQQLQKKVPALVAASKELRLAYALKQMERKGKQMYIYLAEISSAVEAEEIVQRHAPEIEAAGGTIEAGHAGDKGSIVMVKLPANLNVYPANVLPGSGLKFNKVRAAVVAVPKDQGPDPRPRSEGGR